MALAAVVASYSCYLKFAVPVIEGPPNLVQRTIVPLAELTADPGGKDYLVPYLPRDAWELTESIKTLITPSGTIFFKDYEKLADGTIQVAPFTLFAGLSDPDAQPLDATGNRGGNARTPTVLRCIEGANLKFDKPMRDVFANGAKLESARLTGQVDIFRPASGPQHDDALHVMTSNVQIDRQRIFTLDNVIFSFGRNQGRGRNLIIDLAHTTDSQVAKDFSNVNGVRRLELAFLDQLRIEPSRNSSGLPNPAPTSLGGTQKSPDTLFANGKSPLEVSCLGPFVFDFVAKTATFQDRVVAQQMDAFRDNIKCDKLTLTFETTPSSRITQLSSQPTAAGSDKRISSSKLKRFVAEGSPAVVVSHSRSAKVSGEFLSYHAANNRIEGRCHPDSQELVTLVSPDFQMVTKQLTYSIPADGSFGPIDAKGPGRFLRIGTPQQGEFFATWTKSLITSNDLNQPGLQKIVLNGGVKLRIADQTHLDADRIEMLVWQTAVESPGPNNTVKRTWDYQPSKLFTTGKVRIKSDRFDGTANQLTAIWPKPVNVISHHNPPAPVLHVAGFRGPQVVQRVAPQNGFSPPTDSGWSQTGIQPDPVRLQRIGRNRPQASIQQPSMVRNVNFQQPVNVQQPANFQTPANIQPAVQLQQADVSGGPTPTKRFKFHGEQVQVQLTAGKKSEVRDLTVVGNVSIVEVDLGNSGREDPTASPLKITGDRLRLIPQAGEKNYRALVSGDAQKMATVTATDFRLDGVQINLDQAANRLWVDGSGTINFRPTGDVVGNQKPETLDVSWAGGMIFDGRKIYFERNVDLIAERNTDDDGRHHIKTKSGGLTVELNRTVQFQQLSGSPQPESIQIVELLLSDKIPTAKQAFKLVSTDSESVNRPVIIENRSSDATGKTLGQQRFEVPYATVNVQSGAIAAEGPGIVATHQLGQPDGDDSTPNPFARLAQQDPQSGMSFVQVNFDGDLNVDSKNREMIIKGNVRAAYAPVSNWNQTLDPDQASHRIPESVFLTCQRLQLAQWSRRGTEKPVNELIASGNTHVVHQTFEATADRISYNQNTDMLIVEGTPRNAARLFHSEGAGQLVGTKITYRIKTGEARAHGVQNVRAIGK